MHSAVNMDLLYLMCKYGTRYLLFLTQSLAVTFVSVITDQIQQFAHDKKPVTCIIFGEGECQVQRVHNQSDTKFNPNSYPNPTIKQHSVISIRLNIVTCPTYPEIFIRNNILLLSVVIVTVPNFAISYCNSFAPTNKPAFLNRCFITNAVSSHCSS